MKLRPDQLNAHFKKSCLPVYVVTGDTTLIVEESCDSIRQCAKQHGFTSRDVLIVDQHFKWDHLHACSQEISLFGERKLIELRITSGTPGTAGSQALVEYCQSPSPDNVLLIIMPKIDRRSQSSKWFKALDQVGGIIQVWPVDRRNLPGWIQQRMQGRGIKASQEAVQLLSDRVEGNLLAAAQEVDKLALLYEGQTLDVNAIQDAVNDHARYDVFSMIDSALAGNSARAITMMNGLRASGNEPLSIVWALAREIRTLVQLHHQVKEKGKPLAQTLKELGIWEQRKGLIQSAAKRHDAAHLKSLLVLAGTIDLQSKGMLEGSAWDTMSDVLLGLSKAKEETRIAPNTCPPTA